MSNKLVKFVMENLANDAASERSAKKIIECAKKKTSLSNIHEVVTAIENDPPVKNPPLILILIQKMGLLFIGLILPFYYFLTLLALGACLLPGLSRGKNSRHPIDPDSWEVLFNHWGKYPNAFVIKAMEMYYFNNEPIEEPSFEIGVYRGETSRAAFNNKMLRVGMEFVPLHLLKYALQPQKVHQHLMGGDIYDIPFADNTFQSVFSVHSMDDIQRGAQKAVKEMSRVIAPGGKLVFSSYSGYFGDQNILLRVLKKLGLKSLTQKMFALIYIGTHNIYDEHTWRDILKSYDLTLERYVHFVPMWVAWGIDIPFRLEGYLANLFSFHDAFKPLYSPKRIRKIYSRLLMNVVKGIWATSYDANGREKPGINIFVVARKNGLTIPKNDMKNKGQFNFKEALRCPSCRSKLICSTGESEKKNEPFIACPGCMEKYPIVAGIPILLKNAFDS